ncbi:MAG: leucine-rich repeat protein [Clostridia bacterium]|nr:leucine-rich repeat protein [Clostridia bacterium]
MKKVTAILLLVLILVPTIVSCGGNNEITTTETPTTEAPTTESPTTETPTMEAPTTESPTTETPTTEIPTTKPISEYSIKYELNGGTNNEDNPSTYKTGDTITLSFPTKEDYMFMGWYTDSELTSEIKEIADKTEDITLYADWIPYSEVFKFYEGEDGYTISIWPTCYIETIIIPSTYKGIPVIKLGGPSDMRRRSYNFEVEIVIIPDSITDITSEALCTSIVLPEQEFLLKHIEVDANNPNYKSIDGVLYSKDGKELIRYPSSKDATTFTIPDSVTTIGCAAFYGCANLNTLKIPDSVTSIEKIAFVYCKSIEEIVIPDSVTYMERNNFAYCTALKKAVLSSNCKEIPSYAFTSCTALENVVIPEGVTTIDYWAFEGCSSLKNIVIPNSVTEIKGSVFRGASNNFTIYCRAESKPDEWEEHWSEGAKEVIWGYTAEE